LIEIMKIRLAKNGYRFGVLVDTIVGSRQFLNRRVSSKWTN